MFSFVVLMLAVVAVVPANCDVNCNRPYVHYKDLGCTAVYLNPGDCCPSHFECPNFEERSPDKCYIQGYIFKKGDYIPDKLTGSYCQANCLCQKEGDVSCATIDCPVFEDGLETGCFYSYKPEECCPEKICPPYDNLATCVVNGQTYYEGMGWNTENRNIKCECQPGFEGDLVPPFCTEITSCGVEVFHSREVQNKCAPVFYGQGGCPIQWECFQAGDVVVPNTEGTTSEQKCTYGNKKLNIGDTLVLKRTSSTSKVDCKCDIPPFVSCIMEPY